MNKTIYQQMQQERQTWQILGTPHQRNKRKGAPDWHWLFWLFWLIKLFRFEYSNEHWKITKKKKVWISYIACQCPMILNIMMMNAVSSGPWELVPWAPLGSRIATVYQPPSYLILSDLILSYQIFQWPSYDSDVYSRGVPHCEVDVAARQHCDDAHGGLYFVSIGDKAWGVIGQAHSVPSPCKLNTATLNNIQTRSLYIEKKKQLTLIQTFTNKHN